MSAAIKMARANRGDPGLFGDVGRFITGAAGSILPGPLGAAGRLAHKALGGGKAKPKTDPREGRTPAQYQAWLKRQGGGRPGTGFAPQDPTQMPTPGVVGALQRFVPGGATGTQMTPYRPAGYKLNETGYFLKDGTYVEPYSKWVKIRQRNPLNPKAASKAISRLESAKKAIQKINRFSIRKKKDC